MTHRLSFFRPAWSDEEKRARELAGEDLTKLIRMATGKRCQFYVLGKSHPVERLTGVIAGG